MPLGGNQAKFLKHNKPPIQ